MDRAWIASIRAFAVLTFILLASGCATAMYDGPKRSSDEVAFIKAATWTKLHTIDGQRTPSNATFSVLPGEHSISVVVSGRHLATDGSIYGSTSVPPLAVCFRARAGHTYVASLEYRGEQSRPEILDSTDDWEVPARRIDSPFADCSISSAPTRDDPFDSEHTRTTATTPSSSPREQPYESPSNAQVETRNSGSSSPRIGTGLNLELGLAFGGDDMVTALYTNGDRSTLTAGGGVLLSIGGEWTPFWRHRSIGFGLGVNIGFKYNSVGASNGTVSLRRFPLVSVVHALFLVKKRFFLIAKAGAVKDLGLDLSGDGLAAGLHATMTSSLGILGGLGLCWQLDRDTGVELAFRYTVIQYTLPGGTLDGSSATILTGLHQAF